MGRWFLFEYCTKLFTLETMERMAAHFINILKEITNNPQIKLQDIEMLSQKERVQLLNDFNATQVDYPKDQTIYQLFEKKAGEIPEQIAVIYKDQQLTFRELNQKANQLARVLREKGITRDHIVGIMVERSLEMIVGIMAILKAGGAYLPISPDYPEERIKYILQDSGAMILLTAKPFRDKTQFDGEVLFLDDEEYIWGTTPTRSR